MLTCNYSAVSTISIFKLSSRCRRMAIDVKICFLKMWTTHVLILPRTENPLFCGTLSTFGGWPGPLVLPGCFRTPDFVVEPLRGRPKMLEIQCRKRRRRWTTQPRVAQRPWGIRHPQISKTPKGFHKKRRFLAERWSRLRRSYPHIILTHMASWRNRNDNLIVGIVDAAEYLPFAKRIIRLIPFIPLKNGLTG